METTLKSLYLVYDPEEGVDFFDNKADAVSCAGKHLDGYRDCAQDEGWCDDVELLVVAEIITCTKRIESEDGEGDEKESYVDYELVHC